MSVTFSLRENFLTSDPNDYMALVESARTAGLDDVVARMIERGSTLNRPDIIGVLDDLCSAIQSLLSEGTNVTLPFANLSLSIKGVFNGKNDTYDPARHKISVNLNPGKDLRQFLNSGIKVEKTEAVATVPNPDVFTDFISGESNSLITPGGMGEILGYRLTVDTGDPVQGIYFVKEDLSEVKVSVIGRNKPSSLMFMIPAELSSGEYSLEVRTKIGERPVKGILRHSLSVA